MAQVSEEVTNGQVALVALGSNQSGPWGSPRETVTKALKKLEKTFGSGVKASRFFATPAFPEGSGPDFVNAVARFQTAHDATSLLEKLHKIETVAGRFRRKRWAQRTLDIDLLALGAEILPDLETYLHWRDLPPEAQADQAPDGLILPHPRMQDRSFVLVPLEAIAPEWTHPVLGLTVREMCAQLPHEARATVRPLAAQDSACHSG